MAINLNQNTDCCETSCDNTTVNTPGPQGATGAAGANGTNGTDGNNGYSITTQSSTIPSSGAINLVVDQTGWIAPTSTPDSQVVFIGGAGHFLVSGKGTNHITVTFLDYPGDPGTAGDTIPTDSVVSPAGLRGPSGSAANELSNKGELITRTATALSALSVGSNDKVLKADSSTPTGLTWGNVAASELSGNIDLSSQATGTLPVVNIGNSGGSTGDLLYWNGSNWVRLPAVAAGRLLTSQGVGVAPSYVTQTSLGLANFAARVHVSRDHSAGTTTADSGAINIASVSSVQASGGGGTGILTFTINFTDSVATDLPMTFSSDDEIGYNVTSRSTSSVVLESTTQIAGSDRSLSLVIFN